jgi:hypothetical protein
MLQEGNHVFPQEVWKSLKRPEKAGMPDLSPGSKIITTHRQVWKIGAFYGADSRGLERFSDGIRRELTLLEGDAL